MTKNNVTFYMNIVLGVLLIFLNINNLRDDDTTIAFTIAGINIFIGIVGLIWRRYMHRRINK